MARNWTKRYCHSNCKIFIFLRCSISSYDRSMLVIHCSIGAPTWKSMSIKWMKRRKIYCWWIRQISSRKIKGTTNLLILCLIQGGRGRGISLIMESRIFSFPPLFRHKKMKHSTLTRIRLMMSLRLALTRIRMMNRSTRMRNWMQAKIWHPMTSFDLLKNRRPTLLCIQ